MLALESDQEKIVGVLHDVVEDTSAIRDDIAGMFA